jgi:uncharacterized RDD family membrane protein YckC
MAYRNYGYTPEQPKPLLVPVIGVWRRFFAYFVDSFLMWLISVGLGILGFVLAFDANPGATIEQLVFDLDANVWVLNGASVLIMIIYYVGCWALGGQTVGKWLAGVKVVGDDGKSPSLATSIIRYLGYLFNNIVFSVGFLAIAFDKYKQGWHDRMAHTYVVPANVEIPPGIEPVFYNPNESNVADMMAVALYIFTSCILPFLVVLGLAFYAPSLIEELERMLNS